MSKAFDNTKSEKGVCHKGVGDAYFRDRVVVGFVKYYR